MTKRTAAVANNGFLALLFCVLFVVVVFAPEVCFVLCAHVVMTGCVEDALSSGEQICQFVCGQKSVLMVESLWGVQGCLSKWSSLLL